MYIVTVEDDEGVWFDEPHGFDSELQARDYIGHPDTPRAPDGYTHVLYRCYEIPLKK